MFGAASVRYNSELTGPVAMPEYADYNLVSFHDRKEVNEKKSMNPTWDFRYTF